MRIDAVPSEMPPSFSSDNLASVKKSSSLSNFRSYRNYSARSFISSSEICIVSDSAVCKNPEISPDLI